MNRYTFSTQTGKAYYCNSIPGFIADSSEDIEMRCNNGQQLISRTLEFTYYYTASILKQLAGKLDATIKGMGFKSKFLYTESG